MGKLEEANIKSTSVAFRLYKHLRSFKGTERLDVKPWWHPKTIPHHSDFFEEIKRMAGICDFGVFVLSADDRLPDSPAANPRFVANANVILEMGMFIQSLGLESVCAVPEDGTLPLSDLGRFKWTTYNFEQHWKSITKTVDDKIRDKLAQKSPYTQCQIYVNNELHDELMSNEEVAKMGTKSIYIGREQAMNWKNVEDKAGYVPPAYVKALTAFVEQSNLGRVDNVISFGPGVGNKDVLVLKALKNPDARFIPVDINPHLAMESLKQARNVQSIRTVPSAIVDDFEDHLNELVALVSKMFNDKHHSTLFMMLGGTLGNLADPKNFLKRASELLGKKDHFLIDAYERGDDYDFETDVRERLGTDTVQEMLVYAVHQKADLSPGFRACDAYRKFCAYTHEDQIKQLYSVVEKPSDTGAMNISFKLKKPKSAWKLNPLLLDVWRFDKAELPKWFREAGLRVVGQTDPIKLVAGSKDFLNAHVYRLQSKARP